MAALSSVSHSGITIKEVIFLTKEEVSICTVRVCLENPQRSRIKCLDGESLICSFHLYNHNRVTPPQV